MSAPAPPASRRQDAALAAALLLLVAALYAPVRAYPFLVYDDEDLVSRNPHVMQGLRLEGIAWALTHQRVGRITVGSE